MSSEEIRLYVQRAQMALQQSRDNLEIGHPDVATTRAYYAMFYAATALLSSKDMSRSKHSGVHSAFGQYFVKTGLIEPEYGRMLINAFHVRIETDYDVKTDLRIEDAHGVLDDARRFVERAIEYLQGAGYL